jgi:hypothetical protein
VRKIGLGKRFDPQFVPTSAPGAMFELVDGSLNFEHVAGQRNERLFVELYTCLSEFYQQPEPVEPTDVQVIRFC